MSIIVDLHGGDPDNIIAQAEFQEIKDKVIYEVRFLLMQLSSFYNSTLTA